jgi:VWFA-related protein
MPSLKPLRAVLVVVFLSLASFAGAQAPPGFLESLDVRLVNLEVYVTDRQGEAVEGLTAKDFTLLEDGKKVKLSNFSFVPGLGATATAAASEPIHQPARIALFFDNFAIPPQGRKLVLEDLRRHLAEADDDGTLYSVASYDGYLRMHQTFTTDREAILAAVEESGQPTPLGVLRHRERQAVVRQGLELLRTVGQLTSDEDRREQAMRRLRGFNDQIDAQAERQRQQAQNAVFAMSHLVNALAAFPGRKAIVYVGEGWPMRPGEELYAATDQLFSGLRNELVDYAEATTEQRDAALDMRSSALDSLDPGSRSVSRRGEGAASGIQDLTGLANSGRVSFYTLKADVGEGGLPAEFAGEMRQLYTPRLQGIRDRNLTAALTALADETGGHSDLGSGVGEMVARARADLGSYYSIGFQPRRDADGAFHKLKVKLKPKGVTVRHRTGYIDKPPVAKLADRTTAALLMANDENPLGIELHFGPPAEGPDDTLKAVPVILSIPLDFLAGLPKSVEKVPAAIYIAARDPEGRTAPVQQMPLELDRNNENGRQTTGFRLLMRQGEQRLAIGFVVPTAGATAFVSGDLVVAE